jgi:hypothetical protein
MADSENAGSSYGSPISPRVGRTGAARRRNVGNPRVVVNRVKAHLSKETIDANEGSKIRALCADLDREREDIRADIAVFQLNIPMRVANRFPSLGGPDYSRCVHPLTRSYIMYDISHQIYDQMITILDAVQSDTNLMQQYQVLVMALMVLVNLRFHLWKEAFDDLMHDISQTMGNEAVLREFNEWSGSGFESTGFILISRATHFRQKVRMSLKNHGLARRLEDALEASEELIRVSFGVKAGELPEDCSPCRRHMNLLHQSASRQYLHMSLRRRLTSRQSLHMCLRRRFTSRR